MSEAMDGKLWVFDKGECVGVPAFQAELVGEQRNRVLEVTSAVLGPRKRPVTVSAGALHVYPDIVGMGGAGECA